LTAVEDFVAEHRKEYEFFYVEEEFGLGVLFRKGQTGTSPSFSRWRKRTRYYQLRARLHGIKSKLTGR
jgi:hypothetical protein